MPIRGDIVKLLNGEEVRLIGRVTSIVGEHAYCELFGITLKDMGLEKEPVDFWLALMEASELPEDVNHLTIVVRNSIGAWQ